MPTKPNYVHDQNGTLLYIEQVPITQEEANLDLILEKMSEAIATLGTALAQPSPGAGTLNTAALSTAVRQLDTQMRLVIRTQRNMLRFMRNQFDAVD